MVRAKNQLFGGTNEQGGVGHDSQKENGRYPIAGIQEVSKLISSFANQSRLLTLNAHIESARSGEVGRGFAVIAKEIGKLSDMTKRRAADVQSKVQEIVAHIAALVALNQETQYSTSPARNWSM
ncbi:methyl-accepting chemotaxis protein [Alicyclobacillus fastidiosus]|uniref:Methyl-accepting chemotaxis protein n=1 Tax=Alicyclobacillus fastidiosus TaxID=392011 RepID=A0ABY6ZKI4_9BACL|nr:methyl-accepting chemotaxis protein [Alicyclobacillus fastidiosus]WAH42681.1 methyl-accepting chemotaxis protein [Alicyclobacillus fastidiosus]GMA64565.1 hypothetical protein GCM10025859_50050 [Alicyclobacillus fastidiosus]